MNGLCVLSSSDSEIIILCPNKLLLGRSLFANWEGGGGRKVGEGGGDSGREVGQTIPLTEIDWELSQKWSPGSGST